MTRTDLTPDPVMVPDAEFVAEARRLTAEYLSGGRVRRGVVELAGTAVAAAVAWAAGALIDRRAA